MTETQKLRDQLAAECKLMPELMTGEMFTPESYQQTFIAGWNQGEALANEAAQKEIEKLKKDIENLEAQLACADGYF
jgi:hypothetical protein